MDRLDFRKRLHGDQKNQSSSAGDERIRYSVSTPDPRKSFPKSPLSDPKHVPARSQLDFNVATGLVNIMVCEKNKF